MPNHCHALVEPNVPLRRLLAWWKGQSARLVNRMLERTGQPFWQDESYDRWMRTQREMVLTANYIERNPVSAGLVERAEDWQWSSAWRGRAQVDWGRATA